LCRFPEHRLGDELEVLAQQAPQRILEIVSDALRQLSVTNESGRRALAHRVLLVHQLVHNVLATVTPV
jgi:hypothetical protein